MRANELSMHECGLLVDAARCTPTCCTSSRKTICVSAVAPVALPYPYSHQLTFVFPSTKCVTHADSSAGPPKCAPSLEQDCHAEHGVPYTTRRVRLGDQRILVHIIFTSHFTCWKQTFIDCGVSVLVDA